MSGDNIETVIVSNKKVFLISMLIWFCIVGIVLCTFGVGFYLGWSDALEWAKQNPICK